MSVFSSTGIIFLVCAIVLFAYQVMAALMGMGASNDFMYENIILENLLSDGFLEWVDGISSATLQGLTYTVITMPLVLLLLCGALFFFLIHMLKGHKVK